MIEKNPRDNIQDVIKKVGKGKILFTPGEHDPVKLTGVNDIELVGIGDDQSKITEGKEAAIFLTKCKGVIIHLLDIGHTIGRAIRLADCEDITIVNNSLRNMQIDGILAAFCKNISIIGNFIYGSIQKVFEGKTPHCIYISCSSENIRIENNYGEFSTGSLVQCNGNNEEHSANGSPFTGWIKNATIVGNKGFNCCRSGADLFNMERVMDSSYDRNQGIWTKGYVQKGKPQSGGVAAYNGTHNVIVKDQLIWSPENCQFRHSIKVDVGSDLSLDGGVFFCQNVYPNNLDQKSGKITYNKNNPTKFLRPEDAVAARALFKDPDKGDFTKI